jgi:NTP pyrophosphatase (non-canonical NTP hydrolase)
MDLSEYQRRAAATDQQVGDPERQLLVALLGLAGEVGSLMTEHKKWLRDGDAHDRAAGVAEDVGDILWYLAATASTLGLDLSAVAHANLAKVSDRWPPKAGRSGPYSVALPPPRRFDETFPLTQRLPRQIAVALAPLPGQPDRVIGLVHGGGLLGNVVGDNAYDDDGYRWHDALHLAHMAVLGWSPVIRALLGRKRKDDPRADEVEDGGRAIAIEEGIAASVFEYASRHRWLEGLSVVDTSLLTGLCRLTRGLEVARVTPLEWEQAILRGFGCWRHLRQHNGGLVSIDLDARRIDWRQLTKGERSAHGTDTRQALGDRARK